MKRKKMWNELNFRYTSSHSCFRCKSMHAHLFHTLCNNAPSCVYITCHLPRISCYRIAVGIVCDWQGSCGCGCFWVWFYICWFCTLLQNPFYPPCSHARLWRKHIASITCKFIRFVHSLLLKACRVTPRSCQIRIYVQIGIFVMNDLLT